MQKNASENKDEIGSKEKIDNKTKKKTKKKIIITVLILLLVIIGGIAVALINLYQKKVSYYETHYLPNTYINDSAPLSALREKINEMIKERI